LKIAEIDGTDSVIMEEGFVHLKVSFFLVCSVVGLDPPDLKLIGSGSPFFHFDATSVPDSSDP
jgi:hypothetical protein